MFAKWGFELSEVMSLQFKRVAGVSVGGNLWGGLNWGATLVISMGVLFGELT